MTLVITCFEMSKFITLKKAEELRVKITLNFLTSWMLRNVLAMGKLWDLKHDLIGFTPYSTDLEALRVQFVGQIHKCRRRAGPSVFKSREIV